MTVSSFFFAVEAALPRPLFGGDFLGPGFFAGVLRGLPRFFFALFSTSSSSTACSSPLEPPDFSLVFSSAPSSSLSLLALERLPRPLALAPFWASGAKSCAKVYTSFSVCSMIVVMQAPITVQNIRTS